MQVVGKRKSRAMDEVKMEKIREFATSEKAYRPPREVKSGDSSDIQDLDEIKLHELKEVKRHQGYTNIDFFI